MTARKPTCVACKGAGGANYTAGTGIVIEDKEISADTSVLATKTELEDYQPVLTAGEGIVINDDEISVDSNVIGLKLEQIPYNEFKNYIETTTGTYCKFKEDVLIVYNVSGASEFVFHPKTQAMEQSHISVAPPSSYMSLNGTQLSFISDRYVTYADFIKDDIETITIKNLSTNTTYYDSFGRLDINYPSYENNNNASKGIDKVLRLYVIRW